MDDVTVDGVLWKVRAGDGWTCDYIYEAKGYNPILVSGVGSWREKYGEEALIKAIRSHMASQRVSARIFSDR